MWGIAKLSILSFLKCASSTTNNNILPLPVPWKITILKSPPQKIDTVFFLDIAHRGQYQKKEINGGARRESISDHWHPAEWKTPVQPPKKQRGDSEEIDPWEGLNKKSFGKLPFLKNGSKLFLNDLCFFSWVFWSCSFISRFFLVSSWTEKGPQCSSMDVPDSGSVRLICELARHVIHVKTYLSFLLLGNFIHTIELIPQKNELNSIVWMKFPKTQKNRYVFTALGSN